MAEELGSDGLAVNGVIESLTPGQRISDGVLFILDGGGTVVDLQMLDETGGIAHQTGVFHIGLDGVGIRGQLVQFAGFKHLNGSVLFLDDVDLNGVIVKQISQPVVSILLENHLVVLFPFGKEVGTTAHPGIHRVTVGGAGAVIAHAGFVVFFINGIDRTIQEVRAEGVDVRLANAGDLHGLAVFQDLDANLIPFTVAAEVLLTVEYGDGLAVQEVGHLVEHHGVDLHFERVLDVGGIQFFTVMPGRFVTDLKLIGGQRAGFFHGNELGTAVCLGFGRIRGVGAFLGLDQLRQIGGQVADIVIADAIVIGNGTEQGRVDELIRGGNGVAHVVMSVHQGNIVDQIGAIDLFSNGGLYGCFRRGGAGLRRGRDTGVCRSVGCLGYILTAGSGHGQQHHGGHQQGNHLFHLKGPPFVELFCGILLSVNARWHGIRMKMGRGMMQRQGCG